jgi:hypothetical protein
VRPSSINQARDVRPDSNIRHSSLPFAAHLLTEHQMAVHAVAQTLSVTAGAGFYSDIWGLAPYIFGFPSDQV